MRAEGSKSASKERQEVMAAYKKVIAFANNITDEYNDDPDIKASHALLSFGVFMRRLEVAMEDDDANLKSGEHCGKQNTKTGSNDAFTSMMDIIKRGYEIEKIRDGLQ